MDWTSHLQHVRSVPSREGLERMARALGHGARLVRAHRLPGGIATSTYAVDVDVRGDLRRLVLKRYSLGQAGEAASEWERLEFVRRADVPSPEPVTMAKPGEWFDGEALLMTRLPGSANVSAEHLRTHMRHAASALARLHATDVRGARGPLVRSHRGQRWERSPQLDYTSLYARAQDAIERHLAAANAGDVVLCHADFHPGNLVWSRGRLSGIVDWSAARVAPAMYDLAYFRVEVAILAGFEAETFADAYVRETGRPAACLPVWDLINAVSARQWSHLWIEPYRDQGADLPFPRLRRRLEGFVRRALSRLT